MVKKDNKRGREEAHIAKEVEEVEKNNSKKDEVRQLHYYDSLPHISYYQIPKTFVVRYGYHDSLNGMHQGIIEAFKVRAQDIIIKKKER